MNVPEGFLYFENQRMKDSWIYKLIMLIFFVIITIMMFPFLKLSNSRGVNSSKMLLPLLIVLIVWAFIALLMSKSSLEIGVRNDGLYYRLKPFMSRFREIRFKEMECIETVEISAFKYGYGMHFGFGWKAYTVAGDTGIMVRLKNRKSIILSVKNLDRLRTVLSQLGIDINFRCN